MQKAHMLKVGGALALVLITAQLVLLNQLRSPRGSTGAVIPAVNVPTVVPGVTPPARIAVPRSDVVVRPDGQVITITDSLSDEDLTPEISRVMGSPAIVPSKLVVEPDLPAFTEDDLRQYHEAKQSLEAHSAGHFVSSVPTRIEKVEFGTVQSFKTRDILLSQMLDDLNLPDNTLLGIAQYSGAFIENRPPGVEAPIRPYVVEVFDAKTGNRLMSSTMNALK